MIFGEAHLRHILAAYTAHYHFERCHQGVGNVPLPAANSEVPEILAYPTGEVVCHERLGGLLRHYTRQAA